MIQVRASHRRVMVEDPRADRIDYIEVSGALTDSVARRVAKNTFAKRYGADPTRLRTRVIW
jgi:hypothetical protein